MPESAAAAFARLQTLPAEQAVAYLQGRGQLTKTFSWQDLWHDEHAQQFTVSRLARMDILKAMQDGITASVQGDLSRRDWTRDIGALLKKEGWWGEKEVLDEFTGEMVKTKFDPARLKLIFDTNTRMAYAAGLWERIEQSKGSHPYIRYITRGDERVRLQHRRWANLTLPVDHPFWKTRFPPNAFRCRCRAMSISRDEYDRRKAAGTIETGAPPDDPQTFVNQRSGEVSQVPAGVAPGFDYNPGIARATRLRQVAAEKIEALPAPLAAAAVKDITSSQDFARWLAHPEGAYPLIVIPDADALSIGSKVHTGMLSADTATKQVGAHPEMTAAEYALAQSVIDGATDKVQDTAHSLIYIREEVTEEQGGHVLIVKATKTGRGLWVTSYRRLSRQEAERDAEVSRLLAKGKK